MNGETALFGVYMPTLLLFAVIASVVTLLVMRLADFLGFYRFVAYRALVDLCLYVLVLCAICVLFPQFGFRS